MLKFFDPTYWGVSPNAYAEWWYYILGNMFFGFTPRLLASLCLLVSVVSAVTRRFRPIFAILMFLVAFFLTYFGTFLRLVAT